MKSTLRITAPVLGFFLFAALAPARTEDVEYDQSAPSKMAHKLGRGVVNLLTFWVEIPRKIAMEWERTDPVTGTVLGAAGGTARAAIRLAVGAYETVTFPFPVPDDYQVLMRPEFVVTDVWGDTLPGVADIDREDPLTSGTRTYPSRFR